MGVTWDGRDAPSFPELRARLIPTKEARSWDEGELAQAVLNLDDHASLARCDVLLGLACVARRSLDDTEASRAAALREILVELLGRDPDHLSCRVLRALAGLEAGTGGRRREERQRIAGSHLGSLRQPACSRTARRYAREHGWAWLLDRLVELEVRERKAAEAALSVGASDKLEPAPGAGEEDAVDRRGFLQSMGKVTTALLAAMSAESVDIVRHLEASDLGRGTLAQLDGTVERLGREYVYRPLPDLMAEVRAWRLYVGRLLEGRHTLAQRRDLYAVQGWLSSLLGSLAFDLGQESSVGAHYATALQLAGEAGHDELAAWVYGEQAYNAIYLGQPERAVALARAGQEIAPAGSVSAVRLLAWEASGLARMGEGAGFEETMGRATEASARLAERPGRTLFSFDSRLFPFYGASSYVWLGQPRRAVERAQKAIELLDAAPADWPGRRVNARLDLAGALVQLREVEDACAMGSEALGIHASSRQDFNSVRRAIELRSALQPHRALPAVRELDDRFHAVCGGQHAGLT